MRHRCDCAVNLESDLVENPRRTGQVPIALISEKHARRRGRETYGRDPRGVQTTDHDIGDAIWFMIFGRGPGTNNMAMHPRKKPKFSPDGEPLAGMIDRARDLVDAGKLDEGIRLLDSILRIEPEYTDALLCRGVTRFLLGQFAAAVEDYSEFIRLVPDNALAYGRRGDARQSLGQHELAIADYDVAISRDPRFTANYLWRRKRTLPPATPMLPSGI